MEIDRNEKVEFTPEGYQKVLESLTMLPEEERKKWLDSLINAAIR